MSTPPDAGRPGDALGGLLAPSTLRPVELDLRTVFWTITGGFAVALVVLAVVGLVSSVEGRTVAICAAGVGLGFLAQGWVRWRESSLRRRGATATDDGAPGGVGGTPGD
ncbi:DUF2530 domain-containing protein [Actinotalea fermentans]|uniref:DUF2530 domain-containing protein n=1 Tax=Actinotalea fermentans TaxID=43671 RepID=A0A511YXM3_9CELL|nr:DUF2530 domain-containing protein [Actinotalea fermentans]KGM16825.1 hypothetical protein N867_15435 [Actinotalea fermentans ATCC 43279 = JCM 9966 = DSM 3133]GEN79941.1 hypothetical protein AFE02nite_16750 [Actinotalea fermentans]